MAIKNGSQGSVDPMSGDHPRPPKVEPVRTWRSPAFRGWGRNNPSKERPVRNEG